MSNDNFAKQGGEALEIGDEFDSEDEGEMPNSGQDAMRQPMKANIAASGSAQKPGGKPSEVKGAKVED